MPRGPASAGSHQPLAGSLKGGAGDTGDPGGAGDTRDAEDATRVWPALCHMLLLPALTALSQPFPNASTTDPFWTQSKR